MNGAASLADPPRTPHQVAIRRVARRLPRRTWLRGYTASKLRFDPVYPAIAAAMQDTPLPVLDVGCGMGLLGLYLHERGLCHGYLGIDTDARKLRDGRAALAGAPANLRLCEADATQPPPHQGHVVLADILHYLPFDTQRRVLQRAAERLAPAGRLLIRTCVDDRGWRYRATRAEEWLLHKSGWMQRSGNRIPTQEQIAAPLRALGLSVSVRPLWGLTPFSSHLFTASLAQEPPP